MSSLMATERRSEVSAAASAWVLCEVDFGQLSSDEVTPSFNSTSLLLSAALVRLSPDRSNAHVHSSGNQAARSSTRPCSMLMVGEWRVMRLMGRLTEEHV